MIEDLIKATSEELNAQVEFLASTPVYWLAQLLRDGRLRLMKGRITSTKALGEQMTIFGDLGGILAPEEVGLDKYLVKQVRAVLMNESCKDVKSRQRFHTLVAELTADSLKPNITLLRDGRDIIYDGNKTAAAYHYVHISDERIDLSVFVAEA